MKPHEACELAAIIEAKRSLDDAQKLLFRGKRTESKRIQLLADAKAAIERQLHSYPLPDASPKVVEQPELADGLKKLQLESQ